MSLEQAREKINSIDAELVRLLDARARAGREIAAIKARENLPTHQPERERLVLERVRGLSDGGMPAESLDGIFRVVMRETSAVQDAFRESAAEAVPAAAVPGAGVCPGHAGKRDVGAEVTENVEAAPGFWRMRLRCPELAGAFLPGQFFQLRVGGAGAGGAGDGVFLRRPFAPSEYTADGVAFVYARLGRGTERMTALVPGARVRVLAPLGTGYKIHQGVLSALLVGGGCGAPSLAPLAAHLRDTGVRTTVVLGARTATTLLEHGLFSRIADRLIIATDDGSKGCKGTVVDAYRLEKNMGEVDAVYSCGPLPMLRAISALARELNVPCEVSLEERMACGFGACMGCVVPVRTGADTSAYRRVCHDGPVFDAETLAWEEMR